MKIEIRLSDYDNDFDTVFTKQSIETFEEFVYLIDQVKKLIYLRDDNISFKELEDKFEHKSNEKEEVDSMIFQSKELMQALTKQSDAINPSHYTQGKIEVIDFIEDQQCDFRVANVIKYVCRHKFKNGLEDLKKARWYLERIIKEMENED